MTTTLLAVLGTGVVDPATPVARADDAGLIRGDGCFEGCRLRRPGGGRAVIDKLDAHLARMSRSAAALGIGFDGDAWRDLVEQALEAWDGGDEAAAKLVLTRGPAGSDDPTGYVWIADLSPDYDRLRRNGLSVITLRRGVSATTYADAPWLLGGVKTLSYAINMAAAREADRRGADDVIFVGDDGIVLESPTSTVVWAVGARTDGARTDGARTDGARTDGARTDGARTGHATLHTTPRGDTGILGGTTQHLLFEHAADAGWRTADTLATVADLDAADVVWLVSSVRGPVDVVELDGRRRTRLPRVDAEIRRLCGF